MIALTLCGVLGIVGLLYFGVIPILREIANELFRLAELVDFMIIGADRE